MVKKIVYAVTESSEEAKKGLWILDLVERPLSFSKDPRQIVRNTDRLDFKKAHLGWSPDSSQILAHFPVDQDDALSTEANIILEASNFNSVENLRDVTARLPVILSQWEEQLAIKINDQLLNLPEEVQDIATASATNLYFSPDEKKLLYTALEEITIPENLIPPLPGTNNQPETRALKSGNTYIYDIEEDKNFLILEKQLDNLTKETITKTLLINQITPRTLFTPESSPSAHTKLQRENTTDTIFEFRSQYTPITIQSVQWFPDSKHLILTEENKISILEYDNTNPSVVYSGSLEDEFSFPWPDGSKLLIVTDLNPESTIPPNLYSINLE